MRQKHKLDAEVKKEKIQLDVENERRRIQCDLLKTIIKNAPNLWNGGIMRGLLRSTKK